MLKRDMTHAIPARVQRHGGIDVHDKHVEAMLQPPDGQHGHCGVHMSNVKRARGSSHAATLHAQRDAEKRRVRVQAEHQRAGEVVREKGGDGRVEGELEQRRGCDGLRGDGFAEGRGGRRLRQGVHGMHGMHGSVLHEQQGEVGGGVEQHARELQRGEMVRGMRQQEILRADGGGQLHDEALRRGEEALDDGVMRGVVREGADDWGLLRGGDGDGGAVAEHE